MAEEWTDADAEAAADEGWGLWDAEGELQIQRNDDPMVLPDDAEAWRLVADGARRGSALHAKALRLASAEERARIERALGTAALAAGEG